MPVFGMLGGMAGVEGLAFNPMMQLHGEQTIEVHRPLPAAAEVTSSGRISDVVDKGKGAAVVVTADTRDATGDPLCTNRFLSFIRGEGGFGGDPGPGPRNPAPSASPTWWSSRPRCPTRRCSTGCPATRTRCTPTRRWPRSAGDRPILHSLCSYGIVCKAVVDHALDGDSTAVAAYDARFTGVLFPGETIVTSMWREDGRILVDARCKERGTPVIANAAVTTR